MSDRLLTARDVADRLGVSTSTVLRWTRQGVLPGFRLPSGQLRYREEAVEAWIAERATGGDSCPLLGGGLPPARLRRDVRIVA